ncbi:MAG: GIY-YIG nuclease family protein [Synergistaceae bacterium]|jgi:hypothetical protein|nr:GIY-YIG nuclease family protein [Synergistaceae bacterium]
MNAARKELKQRYEQRKIVGGVFLIKSTQGGKTLLDATTDIRGSRNRFDFSQKTGSCTYMRLQEDWKKWGADSFVFEVLEEHEKGDAQTMEEFQSDISVLKDLWVEKFSMSGTES